MHTTSVREILLSNHWFRQLSADTIDELVGQCKTRHYERLQRIYNRDGQAEGLFCLLSGRVRISNINAEGKEVVLTWFEPGSWFGEISLFDGLPRTHDAVAEEPCTLLLLPVKTFQALLARQPGLYPHFMRLLCQRIRAIFTVLDEAGARSLKGQLAKRLLMLASGMGQAGSETFHEQISVSQESLGQMLNLSRQTINKLLKQLQQDGAIHVHYGKIRIIDGSLLSRLSDT